ncbi:MAG: hypothetical protein DRO88_08540 [Promethearchaeia archaeon]|nr:MAG: hypothetical protein DRO88_08540 [Candidatus Lokiarchaeia archaeon]
MIYPVHAFFIDGLLIDTGSRTSHRHIKPYWEKFPIKAIINTHWHEDHIGNNNYLQNKYHFPIYAHELDIPMIKQPRKQKYWLYERLTWGIPKPSEPSPLDLEFSTENYTFQIIHTPGHSPGHISIYEPKNRILFSGDLFFSTRITYLRTLEKFQQQLDGLKKIQKLDFNTMFCSFSGIVRSPKEKIAKKIDFMETLKENTLKLRNQGLSPREIQHQLLGREDIMSFITSHDFSKFHVIQRILEENPVSTG